MTTPDTLGTATAAWEGEGGAVVDTNTLAGYGGAPLSPVVSPSRLERAREVAFDLLIATALILALPLLLGVVVALVGLL